VPELESSAVTVVDQQGRLLSSPDDDEQMNANTKQFDYARRLENSYAERIVSLLAPMLGPDSVRATVSAELDFTVREETREAYDPEGRVMRSEQLSEDRRMGPGGPGGVPGALSNTPPESGPEAAAAQAQGQTGTGTEASPLNESTRSTRNYELDRTLSRTVQPTGTIRRLSVAVLVDDRRIVAEDGSVSTQPLTTTELDELTRLVREAVGFDAARGDSVSVSNVSFFEAEAPPPAEEPGFFASPTVRSIIRQGLWAALLIALALGVLRPIIRSLSVGLTGAGAAASQAVAYSRGPSPRPAGASAGSAAAAAVERAPLSFDDKVNVARQLADRSPERVAQIVRGWVQSDD